MIGRVRESRNPKKVIRVTLMESYGEIGRVPVNLSIIEIPTEIRMVQYPVMRKNCLPKKSNPATSNAIFTTKLMVPTEKGR